MSQSSSMRPTLVFTILMLAVLFLGAVLSVNVGPLELGLWLVVLLAGLFLIRLGSRRPG